MEEVEEETKGRKIKRDKRKRAKEGIRTTIIFQNKSMGDKLKWLHKKRLEVFLGVMTFFIKLRPPHTIGIIEKLNEHSKNSQTVI